MSNGIGLKRQNIVSNTITLEKYHLFIVRFRLGSEEEASKYCLQELLGMCRMKRNFRAFGKRMQKEIKDTNTGIGTVTR